MTWSTMAPTKLATDIYDCDGISTVYPDTWKPYDDPAFAMPVHVSMNAKATARLDDSGIELLIHAKKMAYTM